MENIDLKSMVTLLSEKLVTWYEVAVKSIPNVLMAIVILVLFIVLAKLTKRLAVKLLPKVTDNQAVINLLKTLIYFSVLLIGAFVSLEILNLEKTVTSILAGAGVIGLALGFAFQEIASNFVSGILIAFRKPYKIGDIVEVDNYFGRVTKIDLRTTSITTFQGLEVLIPNKFMFTKPFINFTTTPDRRIDLNIGVSYGDDLEKVENITAEALQGIEQRIPDRDIEIYLNEFGDSSINLTARMWVHYPENQSYLKARHTAIKNIKKAYDENGITIPFPIRTLDFGIKGGKPLNECLPQS